MSETEMATKTPSAPLHIIAHLDWQREGELSFERSRIRLLQRLNELLPMLKGNRENENPPIKSLILAGQTILLEDIANIQPDLLSKLVIYNAGGRLGIGPFYVIPALAIVHGESLIRNLQMSHHLATRYGMKMMPIAYLPHNNHYPAQLPQILYGFGIDATYLSRGQRLMPLPFRWRAPDGTAILAINDQGYATPTQAINDQRESQPDGPFLWMHDYTHASAPSADSVSAPVNTESDSHFAAYIEQARISLPDLLRPTLHGSLYAMDTLTQGQYSARIRSKQRHHHLQTELLYYAERWLTLATINPYRIPPIIDDHDDADAIADAHHRSYLALLHYSWRLLMHNQSLATLDGNILDLVAHAAHERHQQALDLVHDLQEFALGRLHPDESQASATETYINIWNPHAHPLEQVVELKLTLPDGIYPSLLLAPDGTEQPFGWDMDKQILSLRAQAPALGNIVYTLQLGDTPTPEYYQKRTIAARIIGNVNGETVQVNGGQISWQHAHQNIANVLRYVDGGDAGDLTAYRAPDEDTIVTADMTDTVAVEATPTYERLIIHHRARIAPALSEGKRARGLKALDIVTYITLYENLPGIHVCVSLNNTARDHRLQVYLRTGLQGEEVITSRAYHSESIPITDQPTSSHVTQGVVALQQEEQGLAIVMRGLSEFAMAREDGQTTIALTLLRAINQMDNGVAVSTAQEQGEHTFEFALFDRSAGSDAPGIHWLQQTYHAPLRAIQHHTKPTSQHYLTIDDTRVLLGALKPAQNGKRQWVIRLYNPTDHTIKTNIHPAGVVAEAHTMMLNETNDLPITLEDGAIPITIAPHQLQTLRIAFEASPAAPSSSPDEAHNATHKS